MVVQGRSMLRPCEAVNSDIRFNLWPFGTSGL